MDEMPCSAAQSGHDVVGPSECPRSCRTNGHRVPFGHKKPGGGLGSEEHTKGDLFLPQFCKSLRVYFEWPWRI